MDVLVATRAHLLGQAAIAALVVTRIFTPRIPEKVTYPAVLLTLVSDVDGHHLRGPNLVPTDRVQVDVWATTRDQVTLLGRLVRQRLNGFHGTWTGTGSPAPTITVQAIRYEVGSERFEEEIGGGLCRQSADYFLTFRDSEEQMLTT